MNQPKTAYVTTPSLSEGTCEMLKGKGNYPGEMEMSEKREHRKRLGEKRGTHWD